MPRQNRGYKKGGYFKDSFLLVIACEGAVRERQYFELLVSSSQRIRLKILAPEKDEIGLSSPKWVLDRAVKFSEKIGLNDHDLLWIVIDKDRWSEDFLRQLANTVLETKGWNLAISNPCFEVWLLFHYKNIDSSSLKTCSDLKRELGNTTVRGYDVNDLLNNTEEAIQRSKALDTNKDYFMPPKMTTRLYQLVEFILKSF